MYIYICSTDTVINDDKGHTGSYFRNNLEWRTTYVNS